MSNTTICGNWKNFSIKIVQDSDISQILEFLVSNFHLDEPIGQKLPRDDNFIQNTNERMGTLLTNHPGLSIIAFDQETGDISGLQLVFIWKREEAEAEKARSGLKNGTTPTIYHQRKVMNAIYAPMKETQLGLFDQYEVNEIAWNFVACTGRKYRGQGLASELYARMTTLLKSFEKYKIVYSIFTSPFSRRCAEKTGFVEIERSLWSEAKDEDGNLVLPEANGPEDFVSLMVLKL